MQSISNIQKKKDFGTVIKKSACRETSHHARYFIQMQIMISRLQCDWLARYLMWFFSKHLSQIVDSNWSFKLASTISFFFDIIARGNLFMILLYLIIRRQDLRIKIHFPQADKETFLSKTFLTFCCNCKILSTLLLCTV